MKNLLDILDSDKLAKTISAFLLKIGSGVGKEEEIYIEFKNTIANIFSETLSKEVLKDRFFLEEIIHRKITNQHDYADTLLDDWLKEFVAENPLTEGERKHYIEKELGWDKDFAESAYFKCERDLRDYLGIEHPQES